MSTIQHKESQVKFKFSLLSALKPKDRAIAFIHKIQIVNTL